MCIQEVVIRSTQMITQTVKQVFQFYEPKTMSYIKVIQVELYLIKSVG